MQQNDPFAWMSPAPQQQQPPPQQQQQQQQRTQYQPPTSWPQQQPVTSQYNQQFPPPTATATQYTQQLPPLASQYSQSWSNQQPPQQQQSWNWNAPPVPTSAPPPAPVSAFPPATNEWANDPWNAPAQSWNAPPQPVRTASWGADPFAAPSNQSFLSQSKLNVSSNPFDVGNDDAGFFSKPATSTTATTQYTSPPPIAAKQDYAPPNAKTQRLLRVASMLFERGAIIRADKIYLQDLLLKQDKRAETALDLAENDGNTDAINRLLYNERSGIAGEDQGDRSVQMAREAINKRPSQAQAPGTARHARNSDDEDEQTESLPMASYSNEAPHPAAGGYSAPIPATMSLDQAKQQFTGQILVRVSSKMMFRKWKPCFFCVDRTRVVLYDDKSQWINGTSQPRMVFPLHECMWIAKPSVKKTYSLIDDGRRVYFSTVKENSPQVLYSVTASGMPRPVAYSPAIESRVVAKFASHYPDEISSFAHAVYSVVLLRQREAKAAAAGQSPPSNNRSVIRQSSGYGRT
ncbi:hypothetical protein BASA81_003974 [Batrachochytrium salamandrivorans]|nr:hypothetical protein BASA81_003974 [Batrachochytrium salamandrivorans]